MAIIPDEKDWTWVLDKPCAECGFDVGSFTFGEVPRLLRQTVKDWVKLFEAHTPEMLRSRPDDNTWSRLEYAAHVRDVYRVFHSRINLMLLMDNPVFPNWDQDATAIWRRYERSEPEVVQRELVHAGTALAIAFEDVPLIDVALRGTRSNGSEFTLRSISGYCLHDVRHHLWDVTK